MHCETLQGCVPQGIVSTKGASQGLPLFEAFRMITRFRSRLPPPHFTGQRSQCVHSLSSQSIVAASQARGIGSMGPGEHGSSSFSDSSMQGRPRPEWNSTMIRERSRTPKQVQEQADQSAQSPILQSLSPQTSEGSFLHKRDSAVWPAAGMPQVLACCPMFRSRHWKPLPQVVEHSVQWDQASHFPSMQMSQGCVLQGPTWDLFTGSQSFPPFCGETATCRLRRWEPPPQVQVQALQSSQSAQRQSVTTHMELEQGCTSAIFVVQPLPPGFGSCSMLRFRSCVPRHISLQSVHDSQGPMMQSGLPAMRPRAPQGWVLQGCVSRRSFRGQAPPPCGITAMRRVRAVWPPPHSLSQADQASQAENLQSSGMAEGQSSISCVPPCDRPARGPEGSSSRLRKRSEGFCGLQPIHSDQWPREKVPSPGQGGPWHSRISQRLPSQRRPPPEAGVSTFRMWLCQPLPQVTLQTLQGSHSPSAQSVEFCSVAGFTAQLPSQQAPQMWWQGPQHAAHSTSVPLQLLCTDTGHALPCRFTDLGPPKPPLPKAPLSTCAPLP
mmetsp:Transcript_58795/g.172550  ORF Transcript_58795/g.172550 Transcript_58795/m.172550 type:complete len:551 (-) Transcript_58795:262-1914(-)